MKSKYYKGKTKSFKKTIDKLNCEWYTFKDGQPVPRELVKLVKLQGGEFYEEK